MATSLSRQLQSLVTPQTALLAPTKKKASILFSSTEAASYGRETFYEIGMSCSCFIIFNSIQITLYNYYKLY